MARAHAWMCALALVAAAACATARVLVATVVRTDADVLPARVLMHSAGKNGRLNETVSRIIFALPGVSRSAAEAAVERDGVEFRWLEHDLDAPRLTYSAMFALTDFETVLYLSPYTLVLKSLRPLFECPEFCASFLSPCSFSTTVMVITPKAATYRRIVDESRSMLDERTGVCRPGARPDGLSPEACVLNERFGAKLLNAPLFHVDPVEQGNAALKPTPDPLRGEMRRLPMGCQTAHYLFYPRMRWEVPEQTCGTIRVVDFSEPAFLRPWKWWTYALMDLSWEWRAYRLELSNRSALGGMSRAGVWMRVVFVYAMGLVVFLAWGARKEASSGSGGGLLSPVAPAGGGARREGNIEDLSLEDVSKVRKLGEREYLVVAAGLGMAGWLLSWLFALKLTPSTLLPIDAVVLFGHYKAAIFSAALIFLGRSVFMRQTLPSDAQTFRVTSQRRAILETIAWTYVDVLTMIVMIWFVNRSYVETIYSRLLHLLPAVGIYLYVTLACVARVSLVWLSAGISAGRGGSYRAVP